MGKVNQHLFPEVLEDEEDGICPNCAGGGDREHPCHMCHNTGSSRREPSPEDWADYRRDEDVE